LPELWWHFRRRAVSARIRAGWQPGLEVVGCLWYVSSFKKEIRGGRQGGGGEAFVKAVGGRGGGGGAWHCS